MKVLDILENAAIANLARLAVKAVPKAVPAAARAAASTAEEIGARSAAAGLKLMPLQSRIWDKTLNKFVERAVPIVNHDGRAIVVVEVNGQRVPYYLSSGDVAKAGVTPGKWYPTFGVGSDGWINKAANVGEYYGKKELALMARRLDNMIGDIRTKLSDPKEFGMAKSAMADINQGLSPVSYEVGSAGGLKKPAYALFARMGI
jgi:hypothetical protein